MQTTAEPTSNISSTYTITEIYIVLHLDTLSWCACLSVPQISVTILPIL